VPGPSSPTAATPRPPTPPPPGTRRILAGRWPQRSTTMPLATGFGRGFLVAAGIALLTLIINIAVIRIRRADLAGAQPPAPAAPADPAQPQ